MSAFRGCFPAPVWSRVLVLVAGAVLAPGQRTVSQALRVMGLAEKPGFSRYHKVLNRARWNGRAVARTLLVQVLDAFLSAGEVVLGIDDTIERFAHLILELHERLGRVGLAEDDRSALLLTQETLADVLGFSVVHVNRTVQQPRRDRLPDVRNGMVVLTQRDRLQKLANWRSPAGLAALPCHAPAAPAP